jgi:hypothetical protein
MDLGLGACSPLLLPPLPWGWGECVLSHWVPSPKALGLPDLPTGGGSKAMVLLRSLFQPTQALRAFQLEASGQRQLAWADRAQACAWCMCRYSSSFACCSRSYNCCRMHAVAPVAVTACPLPLLQLWLLQVTTMCQHHQLAKQGFLPVLKSRAGVPCQALA